MGWLPPDDFIPAAEQVGAIVHLTRYVLARAAKHCRVWEDEGYMLQISVNLSARDLLDEQLPQNVVRVPKDNQVPKDPQNEAIVKTTLELAHNMHLDVVAEGVEDEATIRHLAATGCEQAQGYFLSKPMTSDELLKWLSTWQPKSYADRRTDDSRPFKTIG